MKIPDNCRCVGKLCRCTGVDILKDSITVRVPLLLTDAAPSSFSVAAEDGAPDVIAASRATMIADMAFAHRGREPVADRKETRDHYRAEGIVAGKAAFADAKAAGFDDGKASAEAARASMIHRSLNAHRMAS